VTRDNTKHAEVEKAALNLYPTHLTFLWGGVVELSEEGIKDIRNISE